MSDLKNEAISQEKLNNKLKINIEEYLKSASLLIVRLEERKIVDTELLAQIEIFIGHAKNQVKNRDLSKETRLKYFDLIEEEESLRDRIQEDLKRNNELIQSTKKSTDALFR